MTWPQPPNYYDAGKAGQNGYKVILQQPNYPVIIAEPSVSQVGECRIRLGFPGIDSC